MPTIDELSPAAASGDDDVLPVSQGGAARRVTRAQLLAGMQPELAMLAGGLLGRASAGVGAPERIGVGGNLRLLDGILSGPAPFRISDLPAGSAPGAADLLAVSQAGRDKAVPLGTVLAGLAAVPGIDLSGQVVRAHDGVSRSLADWTTDAIPVEAFGAVGDGVTDDQGAFDRAVASGRPVRLGARTYVINGQWTVVSRAGLIGVPGSTVLRRKTQAGGAWISVDAPSFVAMGIDFDCGSLPGDSWGMLIGPGCKQTLFEGCVFRNSTGERLGSGLTIQARDGLQGVASRHVVRDCVLRDNAVHGLWVQAAAGALIDGCDAHHNGAYGICLDYNDPSFQQVVRHCQVLACRAWANQRGISVGNYNETNREPPRWGGANPDAVGVVVSGNTCFDNSAYGIAVAGSAILVSGNQVSTGRLRVDGCGILANAIGSLVTSNVVSGPGQFGIDAGGCVDCEIVDNVVQGCAVGINPGGSRGVRVARNRLSGNDWAITAYQIETDGRGRNFGIPCEDLRLSDNTIQLKDGSGGGIFLVDGPQGVLVARNCFEGGSETSPSQMLWAHTDSATIRDNSWNNLPRVVCNPVDVGGIAQVQYPDALDGAMLTSAGRGVGSLVGQHQAAMAGQIAFIKVTSGGSGYTQAAVSVSGSGSGVVAKAYVRDGALVGIAVAASGAGYGALGATVSITGDGQGATATASVGLPVLEGRRLHLHCNGPVRFKRLGSLPFQDNWTGMDVMVPAASEVVWVGTWGGWQAVSFTCGNYLAPAGDGGVVLRSDAGDVALRPSGRGQVRIGSDIEAGGFVSTLGRGSPEGVIAAPPGSDYRNLNGGVGTTLWLKRSGTGVTGWAAIA